MRIKLPFHKVIVVCISILLGSLCQVASAQIVEEGINSAVDDLNSDISPPDSEGLVRNPQKYYRDYINAVLNGQDFHNKQKVKRWRLKEEFKVDKKNKNKSESSDWFNSIIDFFDSFGVISNDFAKLIKLLLIATLCGFLVYILYKYRDSIGQFWHSFDQSKSQKELPTEMFGLDIRQESLPTDVVTSAQYLWQEGQHRNGLALLLQGTLSKLLHEHDCNFQAGDTETDCCNAVAKLGNDSLYKYMLQLTNGWQQLAYAHQMPTLETFSSLCSGWQELFHAR